MVNDAAIAEVRTVLGYCTRFWRVRHDRGFGVQVAAPTHGSAAVLAEDLSGRRMRLSSRRKRAHSNSRACPSARGPRPSIAPSCRRRVARR